jgi:opacity protein-like surface antigen
MKAIVLLSALLFSVSSYANYFKGGVGYSLSGETKFTGTTSATRDHDSKVLFPLLVAYGFEITNEVYGEIEVAYRSSEYKDSALNSLDPKVFSGAFNLVGNIPMDSLVLTGGLGATYGKYNNLAFNAKNSTGFGVQAFGGVDFKVQENVTLGAELRYFTTVSDINLGSGTDAEYTNTAVMFVFKSYL